MGKVVGGIDRTKQALRGLSEFYQSLFEFRTPHALQTYFGIDRDVAERIWKAGPQAGLVPSIDELHPFFVNIGGRGSGKTYVVLGTLLRSLTDYANNEGIVVRKQWNVLQNSIMADFKRILLECTDGKPEYLVDGPKRREGYYEYTIFTHGAPSKLIVRPEPDMASDREVEDALKGPQYGIVVLDELTQLRQITLSTLQDNLRSPHVPYPRLIGCTNPPVKGHWLYTLAREQETLVANGKKPQIMIARSAMEDNPFLPPDYIERMKNKYKDNEILYEMYINGMDGIEMEGEPVYQGAFSMARNAPGDGLNYIPNAIMYVGMDFGWTKNVAIFGQMVAPGYLNILGELALDHATLEAFGKSIMDYVQQRWPDVRWDDLRFFGDPQTAVQKNMHSGKTTAQLLKEQCGIRMKWKKRRIEHGVDTLRALMTDHSLQGNRPRFQIDRNHASETTMALLAGYIRKQSGGVVKPDPYKDGYYDHFADALRYLTDNLYGNYKEGRAEKGTGQQWATGMKPRRGK